MDRAEFESAIWAALGKVPGWATWYAAHRPQGLLTVEAILKAGYSYAQAEAVKAIRGDSHEQVVLERQRILAAARKDQRRPR